MIRSSGNLLLFAAGVTAAGLFTAGCKNAFSEPAPAGPGREIVPIASLYPQDKGIEKNPEVLYTEKFNDGAINIFSRYQDITNREGMSLDGDVPEGSPEKASLKITNTGGKNDGGHLYKRFSPDFDSTIYLRYYVKYPLISKGYIHHESVRMGGYLPAVDYSIGSAGTCGLGDSRLSVSYEPNHHGPGMDTYLYWGEMRSWNGGSSCYGNIMVNGSPSARNLEWDKWICMEVMVKLNNPATASNGELKVWQDGVEVGHWGPGFPHGHWAADAWVNNPTDPAFAGFRWRSVPGLKINWIKFEFYDDTTPAGESHYIKFAHLVMAKKYIGPIKK
ncbi:hypothetical protein ACX0G9_07800 [Flavitalea flava]